MAFIKLNNIVITGMAACIPKTKVENESLGYLFPDGGLEKVINTIGIKERRIADNSVLASDLCYVAADRLLSEFEIDRNTIDGLIFMSQTGDFRMPATAPILQQRLGLSQKTICFDLGLACSGYVYALTTAAAYLNLPELRRMLILVGETMSKIIYEKDTTNAPLFGDAGSATLLEKGENCIFFSDLNTDGTGWTAINIKSGGCRNPVSPQSFEIHQREDGSLGNDLQFYMNGIDVFNFTMRVVPKSVKNILQQSDLTLDDISYLIFHQANKFMTDFFAKKLKYPLSRVPYSLDRFGNTSSATIPLTIVSELREWVNNKSEKDMKRVLMSGFGAGFSWGSVITDLSKCYITELIEF